jgi:hypothetical protein
VTATPRDAPSYLPVGVKRTAGGGLDPAAKRFKPKPDPAAEKAARERLEAKAALEAKIKAAEAEAERMKRSIREAKEAAERRKLDAKKQEEARKALEKKEAALEKANRAKQASNLLSGFAAARKKHGVGTSDGGGEAAAAAKAAAEAALTPEEQDARAVRRVMAAGTDWQVLDLPPNAQQKWVRQSYRDLAKRLHPDKCKAPGAKDAFQKLSRAYKNVAAGAS